MAHVAGIDVGKPAWTCPLGEGPVRRFANTPAGRTRWSSGWSSRRSRWRCASPPAGTNGRWWPACKRSGCPWWWRIPPGCGPSRGPAAPRRKTDLLDAQVLARYGVARARGGDATARPGAHRPCATC